MTASHPADRFLQTTLLLNALFSGVSGMVLFVATPLVADLLGVDALWALQLLGLGLMLYAVWLTLSSRSTPIDFREVWTAIGLDLGWVVGSGLLLLLGWMSFPPAGRWAIGLTADLVALFAGLQWYGLHRALRKEAGL